jgi:hypothetical protein
MKVSELIQRLRALNPDTQVLLGVDASCAKLRTVEIYSKWEIILSDEE